MASKKKATPKSTKTPGAAFEPKMDGAARLAAVQATGNVALVASVREELGMSAPPGERRDALTRTVKKAAGR